MTQSPPSLASFIRKYCLQHKINIAILVAVNLFWSTTISINSYIIKLFVDTMNSEKFIEESIVPIVLFLSINLFTSIALRYYDWIIVKTYPVIKNKVTYELFSYLQSHPWEFFSKNLTGSLVNKINDISKGIPTILNFSIEQICGRLFATSIGAIAILWVSPYCGMGFIVWAILFVMLSVFLSKKAQKYANFCSSSRSAIAGRIADSIHNILNIKLFSREGHENDNLKTLLKRSISDDENLHWFLIKTKTACNLLIILLTCYVLLMITKERSGNKITSGDAIFILTLTCTLIRDLFLLTNQFVSFSEEVGICRQAIQAIFTPQSASVPCLKKPLEIISGEIIFNQISFKHNSRQHFFINQSMIIHGGEKVGLVGLSGSGKTTFINLILGLFTPDSGEILIDSQNIAQVSEQSLRSQIATIPQEPLLFHRSIADNIRYGCLGASDEEVRQASKKAHCHEFIMRLDKNYDSLVGERGIMLSGGQKQRIAIARAILKNAPIFILDEATSALDPISANIIEKMFLNEMKNKTVIIIDHRLHMLSCLDRILVFNEGKIVADGPHSELLESNLHYQSLWSERLSAKV